MEPIKNKVHQEKPNNLNSSSKKKEGGLSNSSESKGDPNSSSKNLLKDLQAHHYKLGNVKDPLMSQHQADFKDPSLFGNNFNPTLDNNSLRRTNWKLGDALPSEIYNTTYNTVHTPKKSEILPANVLRSSGINLVSNNTPLDYLTDYRDNFNF